MKKRLLCMVITVSVAALISQAAPAYAPKPAGTHSNSVIFEIMTGLDSLDKYTNILNSGNITQIDLRCNNLDSIEPLKDMSDENKRKVTYIDLCGNKISDLSPLDGFTGLTTLLLCDNAITDISPLASLTGLQTLDLSSNLITNASPLSNLTGLKVLSINNNKLNSVVPLSRLTQLEELYISHNNIQVIEPLKSLAKLNSLDVSFNKIHEFDIADSLPSLKNLLLTGNAVDDIDLSSITSPNVLFISENPLSGEVLLPKKAAVIGDYSDESNFKAFLTDYKLLKSYVMVMASQSGSIWARTSAAAETVRTDARILTKSDDHGETWRNIYTFENPINAIFFDIYGSIFVSTSHDRWSEDGTGELFKSQDGGKTFTKVLQIQSGVSLNWNITSRHGTIYVSEYGFKDNGDNARRIYRSVNRGIDWEMIFEPEPRYNYHNHKLLAVNGKTVYQSVGDRGNSCVMISEDGGDNWRKVIHNINPTAAVDSDTHIVWGLDSNPFPSSGIALFNKNTQRVESVFTPPFPFGGSCYDMAESNGVIYALFLSYAHDDKHPGAIFASEDNGITWNLFGYIEKTLSDGVGLYELTCDGKYGYIDIGTPIRRNGVTRQYRGTLRFELLK